MHFVLPGFRLVTSYLLDCIMRDSSEVAFNLQAECNRLNSELSALREENERLKSESFEELYNAVIDERDALREELAIAVEQVIQHEENCWPTEAKTYRQRLTAAEQRNAELVELLKRGEPVIRGRDIYGAKQLANEILAALKPTESGASE